MMLILGKPGTEMGQRLPSVFGTRGLGQVVITDVETLGSRAGTARNLAPGRPPFVRVSPIPIGREAKAQALSEGGGPGHVDLEPSAHPIGAVFVAETRLEDTRFLSRAPDLHRGRDHEEQ